MSGAHIGAGNQGQVFPELFNGKLCAVKKVPDHHTTDEQMQREYEIYCTINHKNVVKLVDRIEKHGQLWYIPMELINGDTLNKIIFHPMRRTFELTLQRKSHIITGMCEGLLYLHNKNIIHRDLKPDNIMVERRTLRPVIIDFGFAKFNYEEKSEYYDYDRGNQAYAPSENLRNPIVKRNRSSDVWAMGKIITELLVEYEVPSVKISPAHIQTLLREYPAYCEPVSEMLDKPIPRATMASVIGQIRRAVGRLARSSLLELLPGLFSSSSGASRDFMDSLSGPRASSMNALQPSYSHDPLLMQVNERIRHDLPPGFRLPNPLPHNATVTLNHHRYDHMGRRIDITGELRTRNGRVHDVWWTVCKNDDDPCDDDRLYLK